MGILLYVRMADGIAVTRKYSSALIVDGKKSVAEVAERFAERGVRSMIADVLSMVTIQCVELIW